MPSGGRTLIATTIYVVGRYDIPATTIQRTYNVPTTILQRTYYIMFTAVVYTGLYIIYIVVMSSGRRTAAVCVLYPMRGIVHRRVYI